MSHEILVGETFDRRGVALPSYARLGHVQVIAATGRGKTESVIIPWMVQDTIHGISSILIDAKGDGAITEKVWKVYKLHNLNEDSLHVFDLGRPESSARTNPLKYGSNQQIADRLFSTFIFENIYFKNVSYEAALLAIDLIRSSKAPEVTFEKIYDALMDDEIFTSLLAGNVSNLIQSQGLKFLAQPYRDRQEKLSGFLSQIQPFAKGELSHLLNGGSGSFSVSELIDPMLCQGNRSKTIIISIPTLLYQETASALGKMFLQEIAWSVASRERRCFREFTSVFLDEFSAFVYPSFVGLLNKARSSGVGFHLSHQSLGDLEAISPEFAKAINTNTNIKCVLGVNDPLTADFFAKHFGTKDTEKTTERVQRKTFGDVEKTGLMSLRETEQYKIHPNKLREYSQGRGVLNLVHEGYPITEELQFFRCPI